ncbi:unnamed protein product [Urochloa decumbens]|uniref:F-box domain-containing protein n=1 Tax=Urochloa decumbens TaxID=240449 RepID=A0ABC9B449_9POAL
MDLLLDIFCRLDASDLVRCTCTCKPWRRAIIGNVSSLQPRPDCFNRDLLLGFFHEYWNEDKFIDVRLQRAPGPVDSALRATTDGDGLEKLSSFISADSTGGIDMSLYDIVLSSRDGLVLLDGSDKDDLCLCNPLTGDCTFLPYPAFVPYRCVLVTGYDLDGPANNNQGVRIVAMEGEQSNHGFWTVKYQIYSPTMASASKAAAATWEPVKRSLECKEYLGGYTMFEGAPVICNGVIHSLGVLINGSACVLAVDMRTGRTWNIWVPEQSRNGYPDHVLSASRDCQITLVNQSLFLDRMINVWVLNDGGQWTLQRMIDVPKLNRLERVFCPRSGWVLANVFYEQELLIDIQGGSSRPIMYPYDKNRRGYQLHPYEMDWSSYFSRMKHF